MSTALHTESVPHRDEFGAKIGMWLFLLTELLLFGGLFLLYAVNRGKYPEDFHYCAAQLNVLLGGANTLILLTSSLTMVLAIAALQRQRRRQSVLFTALTIGLGVMFLVIKYFEWTAKISRGIYPASPELAMHTPGEVNFFGLYFTMTGLHGIHVLVGLGLLLWMLLTIRKLPGTTTKVAEAGRGVVVNRPGEEAPFLTVPPGDTVAAVEVTVLYHQHPAVEQGRLIRLENIGLYWHLVDVIWIFLFPLFYLIS